MCCCAVIPDQNIGKTMPPQWLLVLCSVAAGVQKGNRYVVAGTAYVTTSILAGVQFILGVGCACTPGGGCLLQHLVASYGSGIISEHIKSKQKTAGQLRVCEVLTSVWQGEHVGVVIAVCLIPLQWPVRSAAHCY